MAARRGGESAARGGAVLLSRFAAVAGLNYGLSITLAWLLPREQFGQVSVVQALLTLGALVLSSGFTWTIAIREARRVAADSAVDDAILRSAVIGNVAVALLLALVLTAHAFSGLALFPWHGPLVGVLIAVTFPLFALNAVMKGVLHGRSRFSAFSIMQVLEVLAKVLVALLLVTVFAWEGAAAVAVAFLAGALVASGTGARALWRAVSVRGPLAPPRALGDTLPVFLASAGFAVFVTGDILGLHLIGQKYGVTAGLLATYQVAVLIARAPYYVADALADAVFPRIASHHRHPPLAHHWLVSGLRWVVLVVVPLEVMVIARPDLLLGVFFPEGYTTAASLVRLLGLGALGMVCCGWFGKALQALGHYRVHARIMMTALLSEVLLLVLLVPWLGAVGAAVAFGVAAWGGALLSVVVYHRVQGLRRPSLVRPRHVLPLASAAPFLALPVTPSLPALALVGTLACAGYLIAARSVGLVTADDVHRLQQALRALMARAAPPAHRAWAVAQRRTARATVWLLHHPTALGAVLLVLAAPFLLFKLRVNPDTQYDEVVYTRAAQQILSTGQLTWSTEPVFVHPPLYFLVQAGWLELLGAGRGSLEEAVGAARYLTGGLAAGNAAMLGLLTLAVTPAAGWGRRVLLVSLVALIAATDPVLLRYGRLALIEPLALFGSLVTLLVAWRARHWSAGPHILIVGALSGVTLLSKELAVFLLAAPVVFGLLSSDRCYARRAVGALVLGVAWWMIFPLWAHQLGATGRFVEVKFLTLQRLLGLLQVTGWNRPGVSFVDAVIGSAEQYATSYVLLATGAAALLWLFFRRNSAPARYLLACLLCCYAFGAYIVVQGTLNEQFFVYIISFAIVGSVAAGDALYTALCRRWNSGGSAHRGRVPQLVAALTVCLLATGAALSWVDQYARQRNDGIWRMAAFVAGEYGDCAAFNASGDVQKYMYSLDGRTVTQFGGGPTALAHGVHHFFLSPKDARARYGEMSPELATWITSRGRLVARFPSTTHGGVQLWKVRADQYSVPADLQGTPGGVFVHTVGSRCGGFAVRDRGAAFLYAYRALGDKDVVGAPLSRSWGRDGVHYQAFNGVLLRSQTGSGADPAPAVAVPLVIRLARQAPEVYAEYLLPPVTHRPVRTTYRAVMSRLRDEILAAGYLGVRPEEARPRHVRWAVRHYGAPVGPPTRMPDGAMRQAFRNVVLERPADAPAVVRMAPVGRAALGVLTVAPDRATRPQRPPALELPAPERQASHVYPFLHSLAWLLLGTATAGVCVPLATRVRQALSPAVPRGCPRWRRPDIGGGA